MAEIEFSSGNYSNVKYWTVCHKEGRLLIKAGAVPWKSILLIEAAIGALGLGIFSLYYHFSHHSISKDDRALLLLMCIPMLFAVVGCFVFPIWQVRAEQAKGDILIYDPDREIVKLPRERLSLSKSQVIEFRILQENPGGKRQGGALYFPQVAPVELQLMYRNPNERIATLLRADGQGMFWDVIQGLKNANIAKIVLAEQQRETGKWCVREL